ncbi:hypothetical protein [Rhizobium sullae]|uniref:hypothetical protein n=1 Tax=Rhizobium sullae TaxID=50338 RepID=UPI000B35AD0D|nr:hypothetical protein [Rhizobium sullae]
MDRKAIQLRVSRSWRGSSAIGAPRWLVLFIAVLMAASPIVFGEGHARASVLDEARFVVEYHVDAVTEHTHKAPCNDKGQAHQNGSCCVSASSCLHCAPVPTQTIVGFSHREPVAPAPPVMSLPGEASMELRPPKLIVIA